MNDSIKAFNWSQLKWILEKKSACVDVLQETALWLWLSGAFTEWSSIPMADM